MSSRSNDPKRETHMYFSGLLTISQRAAMRPTPKSAPFQAVLANWAYVPSEISPCLATVVNERLVSTALQAEDVDILTVDSVAVCASVERLVKVEAFAEAMAQARQSQKNQVSRETNIECQFCVQI